MLRIVVILSNSIPKEKCLHCCATKNVFEDRNAVPVFFEDVFLDKNPRANVEKLSCYQ